MNNILGRPSKDEYFMALAKAVSLRSIDPSTKHGTVVVNRHGKILATGYNSPPSGFDDLRVPTTRPEKYLFFAHSERNAIFSAAQSGTALQDCVFYVTGRPCIDCLQGIIQVGARGVIFGETQSHCVPNGQMEDYLKYMLPTTKFKVADLYRDQHKSAFDYIYQ